MLFNCFMVGLGGCIGAIARYLLGQIPLGQSGFPWMTLLINVAGAVVIGAVTQIAGQTGLISDHILLFVRTGLCGGFTTFSTFSLETVALLEEGNRLQATAYIGFSVALCLLGVWAGKLLVRNLLPA
ncbi:fluoride efflux transporter CrcB [Solibaculum mannosilyticum]|uniref:fluoride efflux transporter CrcB n=1 Tax=Solibaculum mannosilyticum TaxID=2780922 RepID=UPI0034C0985E